MIDEGSFWLGLFFGFAIAGIGGWILGRIRLARNSMHAADRPLSVQTGKTPRQVLATAADRRDQLFDLVDRICGLCDRSRHLPVLDVLYYAGVGLRCWDGMIARIIPLITAKSVKKRKELRRMKMDRNTAINSRS